MPTNLAIDDELLAEAQRLGQFKTKKTVTQALRLFVQREKQKEILALFGTLDFDDNKGTVKKYTRPPHCALNSDNYSDGLKTRR